MAPPFWLYMYGAKGLILIPRYSKYFVVYNFYVTILLLYSNIIEDTFYWVFIFVKKC